MKKESKREVKQKAREKQRGTLKSKQKCPFLVGPTVFLKTQKRKAEENKTKKQTPKNKEGLGPSEVALWATSPDP